MNEPQAIRERLRAGDTVVGVFSKSLDPAFVEATGYAGFDFIILDTEHGPLTVPHIENNCRAASASGILPIVRVGAVEKIGRALDAGAAGCQVPHVDDAAGATKAVRLARFSPLGERGVCRFVRAAKYSSVPGAEYYEDANRTLVILQLEGKKGLENIDSILEAPAFDVLFIGPYDLSASLGVIGQVESPEVTEAMEEIVKKARAKKVSVGTFVDTAEQLERWRTAGVQYIAWSVDVGIYYQACRRFLDEIGRKRES